MENGHQYLLSNDATIFGVLMLMLGFVFHTSSSDSPFWKKFYSVVPSLLLCYFLPSLLTTFGLIDPEASRLYFVASRYLLPASLVLLMLNMDLKGVLQLGPKALIMFLTGTTGIVLGGPIAFMIIRAINPEALAGTGGEAVWRGLTTVAGSWIGGGANQAAMKEIFEAADSTFGAYITVDVIVANIWMAFLLYAAGRAKKIDASTGADTSAIEKLRAKIEDYQAKSSRIPSMPDLMRIVAVGFVATGLAHFVADIMAPWMESLATDAPVIKRMSLASGFFWLIIVATICGIGLSFTRARKLEAIGASKVGSVFIYVLVATIGMKMDLRAIGEIPWIFALGLIWIAFHAGLLILVAKIIRAPVFFLAVGSQANVGGAASAPIVASAFHPALAPVGVLLAVVGYALGTFAAYGCGQLLRMLAGA